MKAILLSLALVATPAMSQVQLFQSKDGKDIWYVFPETLEVTVNRTTILIEVQEGFTYQHRFFVGIHNDSCITNRGVLYTKEIQEPTWQSSVKIAPVTGDTVADKISKFLCDVMKKSKPNA
jgi:hypothetical protein